MYNLPYNHLSHIHFDTSFDAIFFITFVDWPIEELRPRPEQEQSGQYHEDHRTTSNNANPNNPRLILRHRCLRTVPDTRGLTGSKMFRLLVPNI
jgi:hypothetical protein